MSEVYIVCRAAPQPQPDVSKPADQRALQDLRRVASRNISVVDNSSSSHYDALTIGIARRFSRGLLVEIRYVCSSAMTYSMFFGEPDTGIPSDWGNSHRLEYAPSDFHRWVSRAVLKCPLGWQLAGVATGLRTPGQPADGRGQQWRHQPGGSPAIPGPQFLPPPMQAGLDLSRAKSLVIREPLCQEIRAEVFNLLNRSNSTRRTTSLRAGRRLVPCR